MFLFDIGPIILGPPGYSIYRMIFGASMHEDYAILLPVAFILSYALNLVLTALILKFCGKPVAKNAKKILLTILGTTVIIFVVEFLDVLHGVISAVAMLFVYAIVFSKNFGLTPSQVICAALCFAILTNPFFYYAVAPDWKTEFNYRNGLRMSCTSSLAMDAACYYENSTWRSTGRVTPVPDACFKLPVEDKSSGGENCLNCATRFCFDDVNNPAYVCCGPTPS